MGQFVLKYFHTGSFGCDHTRLPEKIQGKARTYRWDSSLIFRNSVFTTDRGSGRLFSSRAVRLIAHGATIPNPSGGNASFCIPHVFAYRVALAERYVLCARTASRNPHITWIVLFAPPAENVRRSAPRGHLQSREKKCPHRKLWRRSCVTAPFTKPRAEV